jgi:hypothetical protein
MPHSKPAVFGIYKDHQSAEKAIALLQDTGVSRREISVILPHKNQAFDPESMALEGAEVGAGAGAVLGSIIGTLAGAGLIAIPGFGAVAIAGPIIASLVTAGSFAGIGGLWGALIGLGIPEKEAQHFQGHLHQGRILLSVHSDDPTTITLAKEMLINTGAEGVYSRGPLALAAR